MVGVIAEHFYPSRRREKVAIRNGKIVFVRKVQIDVTLLLRTQIMAAVKPAYDGQKFVGVFKFCEEFDCHYNLASV